MHEAGRALFIGRFQPFHNGHLAFVQEIAKAPDVREIFLLIGSANNTPSMDNPFTAEERSEMIYRNSILFDKRVIVDKINNYGDTEKWVRAVKQKCDPFRFFYSSTEAVTNTFREKGYETRLLRLDDWPSGSMIRQTMIFGGDWKSLVPKGTADVVNGRGGVERLKKMKKWASPTAAADTVVDYDGGSFHGIVLIRRDKDPYQGMWSLPGGHCEKDETVEATAIRELEKKTGLMLNISDLNILNVYSSPGRDPRGWYISTTYHARACGTRLSRNGGTGDVQVFLYPETPRDMAFDHRMQLDDYFERTGRPQFSTRYS